MHQILSCQKKKKKKNCHIKQVAEKGFSFQLQHIIHSSCLHKTDNVTAHSLICHFKVVLVDRRYLYSRCHAFIHFWQKLFPFDIQKILNSFLSEHKTRAGEKMSWWHYYKFSISSYNPHTELKRCKIEVLLTTSKAI